ncbi:MAG: prepilin-type N-terminal cleavage/methylation domain-containing protein [Deltaproteobacteria bacterium]|nr:prepilin-type N-terminal cleavage/methylation domain-containing protein [Deltaproteobacteria bacterium]
MSDISVVGAGFKSAPTDRGMSLIELLVAMAIVGIMFGLAAVSFSNIFEVQMKGTSAKIASTIRYLRSKAITEKLYLRIEYNFDDQTYRVESTKDPFVISKEELTEESKPEAEKKEPKGDETEEATPLKSVFSEEESFLLKAVKLPNGIFWKDVWMGPIQEKRTTGKAYTFFFPNGYVTSTVVNLRNEDDDSHYSLDIEPYSGHVVIRSEYLEPGREE